MRNTRGFTLIELLVVIAIIGLLASIIMVSLSGAKSKSRDARRQADIKSIQLALSLYYNDNGFYPRNIYSTSGTAPANGLAPTYLPTVPRDPNGALACINSGVAGCYKYVAYGTGANCNATTNPPLTYHLGAAVEDTSGGVTANDVDADNGGTYVYTGYTACTTGVVGAATFNGNATACTGTAAATDVCYDVAP
jgi:type II secretion system protein G